MRVFAIVALFLASFNAFATVQKAPCSFQDNQRIQEALKGNRVNETVKGLAAELKDLMSREIGPACIAITDDSLVSIPEEHRFMYEVTANGEVIKIAIAENFLNGAYSSMYLSR